MVNTMGNDTIIYYKKIMWYTFAVANIYLINMELITHCSDQK